MLVTTAPYWHISQHCEGIYFTFLRTRSYGEHVLQVYGFMAIVLCLLLASLCVIKKVCLYTFQMFTIFNEKNLYCRQRQEDERFKKIDAKRGGRGFVWDTLPLDFAVLHIPFPWHHDFWVVLYGLSLQSSVPSSSNRSIALASTFRSVRYLDVKLYHSHPQQSFLQVSLYIPYNPYTLCFEFHWY